MGRKTIIACIAALAALTVLVAIAVAVLYSGETGVKRTDDMESDERAGLVAAVPSDAVAVFAFSSFSAAAELFSDSGGCFSFFAGNLTDDALAAYLSDRKGTESLRSSRAVLSLHYSGTAIPMLAVDAGRSGNKTESDVRGAVEAAEKAGLRSVLVDCSGFSDAASGISGRSVLLVSTSEVLLRSAVRHIERGMSVLDSDGFRKCLSENTADNVLYLQCRGIGKSVAGMLGREYYRHAEFFKRFAEWAVLSLDSADKDGFGFSGRFVSDGNSEDFKTVLASYAPSRSRVAEILPASTEAFVSLPLSDVSGYIEARDSFLDRNGNLGKVVLRRKQLLEKTGTDPLVWASDLDIKEVAYARVMTESGAEDLLLLHAGNGKETTVGTVAGPYEFGGFAASVFGDFFALEDESSAVCNDGWIIVGSPSAVAPYAASSGKISDRTLSGKMSEAGIRQFFGKEQYLVAYMSVSGQGPSFSDIFASEYAGKVRGVSSGYDYVPSAFCLYRSGGEVVSSLDVKRLKTVRKQVEEPVAAQVRIPEGPFRVKNSGTGKMNLFSLENGNLVLSEEGGKRLWSVRFPGKLCGNAGTIDYFANGKLQILFASGKSIYLIDRLGRFVSPFPLELDREILLGPGIYDFNGARRYNVVVLHGDNTIEMYNLQGKRPAQWKTIAPKETVVSMPELVKVGGRSYWVVRTSLQTLIYGFYGGEPLTRFEGEDMLRPDSSILPAKGSAVTAVNKAGKTVTIALQ